MGLVVKPPPPPSTSACWILQRAGCTLIGVHRQVQAGYLRRLCVMRDAARFLQALAVVDAAGALYHERALIIILMNGKRN